MDQTTEAPPTSFVLPIAAILCISIGVYIVAIGIIILLRQWLMNRGSCEKNCCICCGKGDQLNFCECENCCTEYCNCCKATDLESCCDYICPTRRKTNCIDIIMCRSCTDSCSCCYTDEPLCDVSSSYLNATEFHIECNDLCGACNCQCQVPECKSINCCCFEIKLSPDP